MKVVIFLMILLFSFGVADELSLDQEISQMKQAPAEKKYELMNRIKKRIAAMNGAARAEAISKLVKAHRQQSPIDTTVRPQRMNIESHIHNNAPNPQQMINQQIGKTSKPQQQMNNQLHKQQ